MEKRHLHIIRRDLALTLFCAVLTPALITVAQTSPVRSQSLEPRPVNLNFEEGELGQFPKGWVYPVPKSYVVELSEDNPKAGRRSAVLRSQKDAQPGESEFGVLMQAFDATPYQGRRVRFRAAVRLDGEGSTAKAQLWMRVDRKDKKPGFFDNMGDRPIRINEWHYYEIVGNVDDDALSINIGIILLGKGKAWLDDVSFEDQGRLIVHNEPARALTRVGLENVIAFTRLLGYVRHFHPSDEAVATDWDRFAVEGIRIVESAKGPAELVTTLESLFRSIAPTVRVFLNGKNPPIPQTLKPPKDVSELKVVSWRHLGFGQKRSRHSTYMSEVQSKTIVAGKLPENSPDPEKPFMAVLGGGVSCIVPLALYADSKRTLPHQPTGVAMPKPEIETYSGNDRATRLADVALAWNVLQHFYPYFDVVKTDWQQALSDALSAAALDPNERAFLDTLRLMIAKLQDGHGGVYHQSDYHMFAVPVIFGWVEGRLIVTDVAESGAEGLQPGDVVLSINGKPSLEVLVENEKLISSATPQWRRYRAISDLRLGDKDSELRLEVQSQNGPSRAVVLHRTIEFQALREARPAKVTEIKPGIYYLDLDRISDADFLKALPKLETATGVIFDLRGYPSVSPVVISHLIDKPVQSARWNIPLVTAPDHSAPFEYETAGRWTLEPIVPRIKGKVALITDGRAISYAESYMGIIEAYKIAEIVGEPTAGTNGNINPLVLPGDYRVVWTGMKVLKHDGSRHHGVGIQPTVPVSRTIRGFAERRDEQLERAISVVSK